MSNTLPNPSEGLVYTNPTTGSQMVFEDGRWVSGSELLLKSGQDSMQGTLFSKSNLINSNTLDTPADSNDVVDLDKMQWNEVIIPSNDPFLRGAANDGSLWVVVGSNGTICTSYDAITWTKTTDINRAAPVYVTVIYGNARWVVVGGGGKIRTSEDGFTWTTRTSGTSNNLNAVKYSSVNNLYVAVGNNGTLLESGDAISWVKRDNPLGFFTNMYTVEYAADQGIWVIGGVGGYCSWSEDGSTWNPFKIPNEKNVYWLKYNQGLWIGVQTSAQIIRSTNGKDWEIVDLNHIFEGFHINKVEYGAGLWVLTANDGRMATSLDGRNWNDTGLSSLKGIMGTGRVYALDYNDTQKLWFAGGENSKAGVAKWSDGVPADLLFNGENVIIEEATTSTSSLKTASVNMFSTSNRPRFFQDSEPSNLDSYSSHIKGSMWYNTSSSALHYYNDSDNQWIQL